MTLYKSLNSDHKCHRLIPVPSRSSKWKGKFTSIYSSDNLHPMLCFSVLSPLQGLPSLLCCGLSSSFRDAFYSTSAEVHGSLSAFISKIWSPAPKNSGETALVSGPCQCELAGKWCWMEAMVEMLPPVRRLGDSHKTTGNIIFLPSAFDFIKRRQLQSFTK